MRRRLAVLGLLFALGILAGLAAVDVASHQPRDNPFPRPLHPAPAVTASLVNV